MHRRFCRGGFFWAVMPRERILLRGCTRRTKYSEGSVDSLTVLHINHHGKGGVL
jgi:hypothetical protein